MSWVIKEIIILKSESMNNEEACDLVIGYDNKKLVDLVEMKHGEASRQKAKHQLRNTKNHFVDKIGYGVRNSYIVYYPSFKYEVYP